VNNWLDLFEAWKLREESILGRPSDCT
jgi:hypothetical protein